MNQANLRRSIMADVAEPDARLARVHQNLRARSNKLAGLYCTALRALDADPEPDCEAARVSVICHCMRELMLGLPLVLTDAAIPRPKPSSSSILAKLPALVAEHPDLDLSLEQDVLPVPKKVAAQLDMLVKTRIQEDGRNQRNTNALVGDGSESAHPAIKQWKNTYDFFLGWAHLDRNHESGRELPTDEEIRGAMRVVEDVIEVRTTAFFDNLEALEGLLAAINETDEGDD